MDFDDHQLSHCNPRAPDWRMQQAHADAQTRRLRLSPQADDEMRRAAALFAELLAKDPQDHDRIRKLPHHRDYAAVFEWHEDRETGAKIEALALTGMSSAYAAGRLRVTPADVERYCVLCFDVRDKLDDPSYIMRFAISPERRRGNPLTGQRRAAMKLLAYRYGPQVLIDLYHVSPTKDAWVPLATDLHRQNALLRLDQAVERLFGLSGNGDLDFDEIEACIAEVESFLSTNHDISKIKWRQRALTGKSSHIFEQVPLSPTACDLAPQPDEEAESIEDEETVPTDNQTERDAAVKLLKELALYSPARCSAPLVNHSIRMEEGAFERSERKRLAALEVLESFRQFLATRATAPAGSIDGPGIHPNWNLDIFDCHPDAAEWAQQQMKNSDRDALVGSTLFVQDGRRLRLDERFTTPGSPIIFTFTRLNRHLSGVFAGEWNSASANPIVNFAGDATTHGLGLEKRGVTIAASNSREAAAWRRLGLPAIPLPTASACPAAAVELWRSFARVCGPPTHEFSEREILRQARGKVSGILVISNFDPVTLTQCSGGDRGRLAARLHRMRSDYCDDPRICVGAWLPQRPTLDAMRRAVTSQSPVALTGHIVSSLETELYFHPRKTATLQPQADFTSCRQALASLKTDAPLARRDALLQQFMSEHEAEVVEPLLNEAMLTKSPIERVSINMIAELSRQQAQIGADFAMATAGHLVGGRSKAAIARQYCQTAAVTLNAIKLVQGGRRGPIR